MAILKRFNRLQGLKDVDVFFDEEGLNSNFFNITEFPDPIQVGKNSFLIAGSEQLANFIELKIDVIDSEGNSIYHEPVRGLLEGNARRISIECYNSNAPGIGKLIVVGEANPDVVDVPEEWKGVYNVRYTRPISINTTQINTQPIFFYKQPKIRAREITKAFIDLLPASASYSITGSASITATDPGSLFGINETSVNDEEASFSVAEFGEDKPGKFLDTYKNKRENKISIGNQPTVMALGRVQRRASPEPQTHTITVDNVESSPENGPDEMSSAFVGGKILIRNPKVDESTFYIGNNSFIVTDDVYVSRIQEVINGNTLIPETPFTVKKHPTPQTDPPVGYKDPDFDDYRVWSSTNNQGKLIGDGTINPEQVSPKQPSTPHTDETGAIYYWGQVLDQSRIPKEGEGGGNESINYWGWLESGSVSQESLEAGVEKFNVSMLPNSNVTMSILPTPGRSLKSTHLRSYADFSIVNMRTFSGDVFRIKVYGKLKGGLADFELLYDSPIESPQTLIDPFSADGFLNVGYFYTGSIISDYWASSSNGTVTQNNTYMVDGALVSGSNRELNEKVEFFTTSSYKLERNVSYTLSFDSYFVKGDKKFQQPNSEEVVTKKDAILEVYLSGSAAADGQNKTGDDLFLGSVNTTKWRGVNEGEQKGIFQTFLSSAKHFPSAQIKFVAKSGQWVIKDVDLKPTSDTNFSPDYFRQIIPLPFIHKRPASMDFLVEFYDINNNIANTFSFMENFRIIGAPQVVAQGDNNLLSGSLYLGNIQGQGIEVHGGSAFLRSIGYEGWEAARSSGSGGFMIWSGSLSSDGTNLLQTTESYDGVGLEIVDAHGATDRYLKFRTNPSTFEVVTDQFFLGNAGAHISSSGGSLTITSSNFHLDKDGDVNMAGTITATAGNIGDFQIVSGQISGSNITFNANNSTIFKTDQGPGSDSSAAFDKLRDEYYIDFTPEEESPDNFYIKMGPNFMVDKDGILIASGAEFIGTITASAGLIGGFNIGSASLFAGSSEHSPNFYISGSASGNQPGTGTFISSSRFQVTAEGDITGSQVLFTGGKIGGFTVTENTISSSNLLINAENGELRTTNFVTGTKGWRITAGVYGGIDSNGTAEFENIRVRGTLRTAVFEKETVNAVGGQLWIANSTALSGSASASQEILHVENSSGFVKDEIIFAKKVNGTGFTKEYMKVFSQSRVDQDSDDDFSGYLHVTRSFGGQATGSAFTNVTTITEPITTKVETSLTVADESPSGIDLKDSTIRIDDEIMQVTGSESNKIHVRRGTNGTDKATHSDNANVAKVDPDVAFLLGLVSPGEAYTEGQVLVSTGRYISGTGATARGSGYMLLNANPGDATTPYMDFHERTGSGIYDSRLKTRIGDLSGLVATAIGDELFRGSTDPGFGLVSENIYLKGLIQAESGSIGGLEMTGKEIFVADSVGSFGDSSTAFFVSASGHFSLKDNITWDTSTLTVKPTNINITTTGTNKIKISGSNGSSDVPVIALGTTLNTTVAGTNAGIYMDGTGDFLAYGNSTNYIKFDVGGTPVLDIKSDTFDLKTSTIHISSSNNGIIAMGHPSIPEDSGSSGIYLDGKGNVNLQQGQSYIRATSGSGLAMNYPSYSLNTEGHIVAQGVSIKGNLEAETGFFGTNSSTGWIIDGNKIRSKVLDSSKTGSIEIDATPGSPNITLIDSGSFVAEIVPDFTPANVILTAGGDTYEDTDSKGSPSTNEADSGTIAISNGQTSSDLDLFAGFSDENDADYYSDAGGSLDKAALTANTEYKSTATIKVDVTVQTSNDDQLSYNLGGNIGVAINLLLVNAAGGNLYDENVGGTIFPQEGAGSGTTTTFTFTKTISLNHEVGGSDINVYWHAKDVSVTNNNLQEDFALSLEPFRPAPTVDTNITKVEVYFTSTSHRPSSKKTELAPGGFQSVVLKNATMKNSTNRYVRLSPQETKTVDMHGLVHITGSLSVGQNSDGASTGFVAVDDGNAGNPSFRFRTDNNTGFFLQSADDIGVSIAGSEKFRFANNGHFHATNDITGFSSTPSDKKLKTNIKDINYGLSDIIKLQGRQFDWKRDDRGHDIGVIAQEVQEVVPELVKEVEGLNGESSFLTVSYEKLVPVLIESIKEQQKQIDELRKLIDRMFI